MKKILKTGNFLLPEQEKDPVVLFIFNQFEDDVTNVTYQLLNSSMIIYYPSSNLLEIEYSDLNITNRIIKHSKFVIIEVDDNTGDIIALYEVDEQ